MTIIKPANILCNRHLSWLQISKFCSLVGSYSISEVLTIKQLSESLSGHNNNIINGIHSVPPVLSMMSQHETSIKNLISIRYIGIK